MTSFNLAGARRIVFVVILAFMGVLNAPSAYSLIVTNAAGEVVQKDAQIPEQIRAADAEWTELESQLANLDSERFFSCGPNALYLFVYLSGRTEIPFETVKASVPLAAPQGASLRSLRDAAIKLGVNAEARLYNTRNYKSVPVPAIVHIRRKGQVSAAAHYDIMYKKDSDWVYLLNGTTAQPYKVRCKKFAGDDWWSGYALIEKRSLFAFVIDECWPALATCFLVTDIVLLTSLIKKGKHQSPNQPQINQQVIP